VSEICDKYKFEYRTPDDMQDVLYAEPTLQGNAVIAPRGDSEETPLNLELLFDAVTKGAIETK
jgi:ABC-2 type transport system ATP-binding protein